MAGKTGWDQMRKRRLEQQLAALPTAVVNAVGRQLELEAGGMAEAIARAATHPSIARSVGWGPEAPSGAVLKAPGLTEAQGVKADFGLQQQVWAGDDDAFYVRWVENGTAPHSLAKGADKSLKKKQGKGAWHPGAVAQPFFWPTIRARRLPSKRRVAKAARTAAKSLSKLNTRASKG